MVALDEFIAYVEQQVGSPPSIPGVRSWGDLARILRGVPPETLQAKLSEVDRTFVVPTVDHEYERWSAAKRMRVNQDAARAFREAQARGEASVEQRTRMLNYTGFGGFGGTPIGVLSDDYPAAYVEASRAVLARGSMVAPEHSALMERVLDQFFTPLSITQATWALLSRTNPNPAAVLEPSAGMVRFVRSGPAGLNWTLVEMDPMMAQMSALCFPRARVHQGMFENFATANAAARFDVIVGNPPFGKRAIEMRNVDLPKVMTAEDYFALRAASMLAPGGTLAFVVPVSFLKTSNHADTRTRLLKGCAFRGAALLPSGAFPQVREGTWVIMLWTRLAANRDASTWSERDNAIARGEYLTLPEAADAVCGGEWREGMRGTYLHGAPELSRIGSLWLAPMPVPATLVGTPVGPVGVTGQKPGVKPGRKPAKPAKTPELPSVDPAQSAAVEAQIVQFLRLAVRDLAAAEAIRETVRVAVVSYLADHGNPHPRGAPALRAVTTPDGRLEPVLTNPISTVSASSTPPRTAPFATQVAWWSERRGYATPGDLEMDDESAIAEAVSEPDVMVEVRPEGPVFYARWAYFTGPPAARLHMADAALNGYGLTDELRSKLDSQKTLILSQWAGAKTLSEIDVSPRSPFVPVECLIDWINHAVRTPYQRNSTEIPRVTLTVQDGLMEIPEGDPGLAYLTSGSNKTDLLDWLVGYFNRSSMVENTDGSGSSKRVYGSADARGAAKIDQANVEAFQDWLGETPEWSATIESEYNTKFAPPLLSEIPSNPVDITGLNPKMTLHPHQNQAVRRANLGGRARSALIAYDVGAGKCQRGNSLLLTNQGLVPIASLFGDRAEGEEAELILPPSDGLKIVAHTDEGEASWVPVRSLYRQRISDAEQTLCVSTVRASTNEVTAAHPMPVVRNGVVEWVPAGQLVEGDDLVVAKRLPEPPNAFELDEDLASLIAWQLGDGNENGTVGFVHQDDTTVLDDLLARYQRVFGNDRVTRKGFPCGRIETPPNKTPHLTICDPQYEARLRELDYPWGTVSADRRFPEWFLRASDRTLRTMLRCFFDAEGSPEKNKAGIEISSASRQLIQQLRYALLRFGVRTTYTEKWKRATNSSNPVERPYHYLYAYGEDAVAFHENIGFGVAWKNERLAENVKRERNPNSGIPVLDIVTELAEVGVSVRTLTGFTRTASFRSASVETVNLMVNKLRLLASDLEVARMQARGGPSVALAHRVVEHREVLISAADRLETLATLPVRYEQIASITPGESGGFVYDIEVDREAYGEKNYVGGDGGLILHNTIVGLATAVRWKQSGACRRVLIAVPTSVLTKWYADGIKLFPSAKIGVIGVTPGRLGSDDQATRLEKWLRFAAGAYDICLVGHTSFFQDLEPDPQEVGDLLAGVMWARRSMGKEIAAMKRSQRKRDALQKEADELRVITEGWRYRKYFPRAPYRDDEWKAQRDGKVKDLEIQIARIEMELADTAASLGTDKEAASVQAALRELVEGKPYRPSRKGKVDGNGALVAMGDELGDDEEGAGAGGGKSGSNSVPMPGLVQWSDMAVDGLIVDEAHRFKNLWYPQDRIEYAGGGQDKLFEKKSPWDMWIKTWSIHKRHGGAGGVMFLTATPMTNSPLELYSLLTMVSPTIFEDVGIHDKETFIDRYWKVDVKDVVRPKGTVEPAKALLGFKNLDELNGIISSVFDRKSTADLVSMGWLKNLPEAVPESIRIERDPAQTALVRTLVSILVAWTENAADAKKRREEGAAGAGAGALADLSRNTWTVKPNGELVMTGVVTKEDGPKILAVSETARKARGILRLIWMSLLDKIAIDPRLILTYFDSIDTRGGKRALSPMEEMTSTLAHALGQKLPLADIARYYADKPVVDKIARLAEYVRDNLHRPKGRCGHVVFCDSKELHPQIISAIAETAGIDKRRIAVITGDTSKQKRLEVSQLFNGRDELRAKIDGVDTIIEEAIEPIYDVVIGTSQAMAEGIDLQRRSCAVHHLNLPWEPATLHQRNGRAVRQGNLMGNVAVLYYLTDRTFDGLRFDKVARKAAWWDQMFSGQANTSNPAAAEDADRDLDEVILEMVIEDPEDLRVRIETIRAARSAKVRAERVEKASADWLTLNALFVRARNAPDAARHDALMNVAVRKREAWRITHGEMAVPEALTLLNDNPVVIDWDKGDLMTVGTVISHGYGKLSKVLDVLVRPRAFIMIVRQKGEVATQVQASTHFLGDDKGVAPWAFAEEEGALVNQIGNLRLFDTLSRLPRDLWPHALTLFRKGVEGVLTSGYQYSRGRVSVEYLASPILLTEDGRVVLALQLDGKIRKDYTDANAVEFLQWVKENVVAVLPPNHPDAWAAWTRALKSDRVYVPATSLKSEDNYARRSTGVVYGPPVQARYNVDGWKKLTTILFLRQLTPEVLRQRVAITHETPRAAPGEDK